jgi:hypothetical protein
MRDNFQEQFQNLRKIITTNVSTIRDLVEQSDKLSQVIRSLGDKTEENDIKLKADLGKLKADISKSIDILIEQTNELFRTYEKLVEEIFGKQ